jgi:hypothetical protein
MMSRETPEPPGVTWISEGDISHLSNNVILLQLAPELR